MAGRAYYQPIEGSRRLQTQPLGMTRALGAAESLGPDDRLRFRHQGDLVGSVVLVRDVARLPRDAFDRLAPRLAAAEQAAYFHLLRLSYGEGRNVARAAKRDLMTRLGISERRLNRVLDALIRAGALAPLHRDNCGTLYRVYLPREIAGEPLGDGVQLGRVVEVEAAPRAHGDEDERGKAGEDG